MGFVDTLKSIFVVPETATDERTDTKQQINNLLNSNGQLKPSTESMLEKMHQVAVRYQANKDLVPDFLLSEQSFAERAERWLQDLRQKICVLIVVLAGKDLGTWTLDKVQEMWSSVALDKVNTEQKESFEHLMKERQDTNSIITNNELQNSQKMEQLLKQRLDELTKESDDIRATLEQVSHRQKTGLDKDDPKYIEYRDQYFALEYLEVRIHQAMACLKRYLETVTELNDATELLAKDPGDIKNQLIQTFQYTDTSNAILTAVQKKQLDQQIVKKLEPIIAGKEALKKRIDELKKLKVRTTLDILSLQWGTPVFHKSYENVTAEKKLAEVLYVAHLPHPKNPDMYTHQAYLVSLMGSWDEIEIKTLDEKEMMGYLEEQKFTDRDALAQHMLQPPTFQPSEISKQLEDHRLLSNEREYLHNAPDSARRLFVKFTTEQKLHAMRHIEYLPNEIRIIDDEGKELCAIAKTDLDVPSSALNKGLIEKSLEYTTFTHGAMEAYLKNNNLKTFTNELYLAIFKLMPSVAKENRNTQDMKKDAFEFIKLMGMSGSEWSSTIVHDDGRYSACALTSDDQFAGISETEASKTPAKLYARGPYPIRVVLRSVLPL